MYPVVGIYASEKDGRDAARAIEERGLDVCLLSPAEAEGREGEVVRTAVADRCVAGGQAPACVDALQRGQWVVGVNAGFGYTQTALEILDEHGAVELVPTPPRDDPSPLSDVLGLPVLSGSKPSTGLASFRFVFGEPRLLKGPIFGFLPTLTKSQRQRSTFGAPLLTKSGGPILTMFPLLRKSKSGKTSSFGLPLLSNNPAPLSSMFGLKVLLRKKRDDEDDRR